MRSMTGWERARGMGGPWMCSAGGEREQWTAWLVREGPVWSWSVDYMRRESVEVGSETHSYWSQPDFVGGGTESSVRVAKLAAQAALMRALITGDVGGRVPDAEWVGDWGECPF